MIVQPPQTRVTLGKTQRPIELDGFQGSSRSLPLSRCTIMTRNGQLFGWNTVNAPALLEEREEEHQRANFTPWSNLLGLFYIQCNHTKV